jgi:hypothetical protein
VGASPPFSPHLPTKRAARAVLLDTIRRAPRRLGIERTRWTLAALAAVVPWLAGRRPSSVWRVLRQLGIGLKRGRDHIHSPDPAYLAKRAAIAASLGEAAASGGRLVTLFQDEVTLHRQPSLASAWAERGADEPRAERSQRGDAVARLVATLDARDGRVVARRSRPADSPVARIVGVLDASDGRVLVRRRRTLTVPALVGFYQAVAAAYPEAARIDVILDNWPVHFHPDLLVALQPQACPFPVPRPPSWPSAPSADAVRKWGGLNLPIRLVPLPTYASWLNPIEKLWRWLRQDVVHLHPWADAIPTLHETVDAFLGQFSTNTAAAAALLRYVGLATHD